MSRNSFQQDAQNSTEHGPSVLAVETLRSASESSRDKLKHAEKEPKHEDEKLSIFWRVFGGAILSIVALVSITLFNNISSAIVELRAEIGREREARAELVKKDEFQSRSQSQYERIRAAEGLKADIEGLKERMNANAMAIETVKKDTAGIEVIRERVAGVEAVKKDVAGVEVLKERLVAVTVDLKATRDELQKLQADIEKNRAADLERKAFRDAQAKQIDDLIKEMQKDLQDCRLKLARFEGQIPPATNSPTPSRTFVGPFFPGDRKPDEK